MINNMKKVMSLFLIVLILSLPLSSAAEFSLSDTLSGLKNDLYTLKDQVTSSVGEALSSDEELKETDTGEAILVKVKSYDPTVLDSALLEDDDVPVYAYLTGISLGGLLDIGSTSTGIAPTSEPFYGDPKIKSVIIRPLDIGTTKYLKGTPKYIRPNQLSLDNLGYLIITLKQQDSEFKNVKAQTSVPSIKHPTQTNKTLTPSEFCSDSTLKSTSIQEISDLGISNEDYCKNKEIFEDNIPDVINLNMSARIYFDNADRLFNMIQQDLVLPMEPKDNEWRSNWKTSSQDYSFFGGRGYLRAEDITYNKALLVVYGGDDLWQLRTTYDSLNQFVNTGTPRPLKRFSINKGSTSDYIRLWGSEELGRNTFRVKLMDIIDPSIKRIKLEINRDGELSEVVLKENEALYPGSKWKVSSINEYTEKGRKKIDVNFEGPNDFVRAIKNYIEIKDIKTTTQKTTQISTTDPCKGNTFLIPTIPDNKKKLKVVSKAYKELVYCAAIRKYEDSKRIMKGVKDSQGILYEDKANYQIAYIYDYNLNSTHLAKTYYEKSIKNNKGNFLPQAKKRLIEIKEDLENGATYKVASFLDNNAFVTVKVKDIIGASAVQKPTFNVNINGKNYRKTIGEGLLVKDIRDINGTFNWIVKKIGSSSVELVKKYSLGQSSSILSSTTKTLRLKTIESVNQNTVQITSIDLKKLALVRIIPGTGKPLKSETNFSLHIPVEKRLIKWTPDELKDKINSTQEIIDDLTEVIDKLTAVVKTWKTVCLITFAALTVKNSFFTGLSRTKARQSVMRGADGKGGWNAYCKINSGTGKIYGTVDSCLSKNADNIDSQIDYSQEAIEDINSNFNDYKNQDWYKELSKGYKDIDKYGSLTPDPLFDKKKLRDYWYLQEMKKSSVYSRLKGDVINGGGYDYNLKEEIDNKLKSFSLTNKKKQEAYNKAVDDIKRSYSNFNQESPASQKEIFTDRYRSNLASGKITSTAFPYLPKLQINQLSSLRKKDNTIFSNTEVGQKVLKEGTVRDYIRLLKGKISNVEYNKEKARLDQVYKKNPNAPLLTSQGQVYITSSDKLYVAQTTAYSTGKLSKKYAPGSNVEIYPDGTPYCIPSGNGNFVKILDFYKDGSPNTIQEWNVGEDGMLCTNDDVLLKHQSVLNLAQYRSEHSRLRSRASSFGKHKAGDVVNIGGKQFTISNSRANLQNQINAPGCYDVMDPGDCQTLFGVCDPVMCPPSRFNLGGTWYVNNVVQTGLIGSVVLGLHNFNIPKEPVPICLTGVNAGLQNIRSILEGYQKCLKTALVHGKSVGICDKIRSIFICQLLWKEAMSIMNMKGGILGWFTNKILGDKKVATGGGGEYLTFQSSVQNIGASVNFFTKQYANTAFAAYTSRSTDELGTTICKQAIYGKLPGLGDFIDDLSKPESPPQYTALLSVYDYSKTTKKQKYQVYYHIYAGEDKPAKFSVYLRNKASSSILGNLYYVTEKCGGRTGSIEAGGLADSTIDCVAAEGYNEVCVNINGVVDCGFGSVSSDFSLNYINDLVVEDEAKRDIKSEKECVPSSPTTSPSLGSLPLPGQPSLLTTGISRVCSVNNPGTGTNTNRWRKVGTCGGNLGSCWIDLNSISIKDTDRMAGVKNALTDSDINSLKSKKGITDLINGTASKELLKNADNVASEAKNCDKFMAAYSLYESLATRTLSAQVEVKATFGGAKILEKMADKCAKMNPDVAIDKIVNKFETSLKALYRSYQKLFATVQKATTDKGRREVERQKLEKQYQQNVSSAFNTFQKSANLKKDHSVKLAVLKNKYYNKKLSLKVENKIDYEKACNYCHSGISSIIPGFNCDIKTCHSLDPRCFFQDKFGPKNECHACSYATKCSDFSNDQARCTSSFCNKEAKLECKWDSNKCVDKKAIIMASTTIIPKQPTVYNITPTKPSKTITTTSAIEKLKKKAESEYKKLCSSNIASKKKGSDTIWNRIIRKRSTTSNPNARTYYEIINSLSTTPEMKATIAGLIGAESSAIATAVSSTGCKGLMQFCGGSSNMKINTPYAPGYLCTKNCKGVDNRFKPEYIIPAGLKLIQGNLRTIARLCPVTSNDEEKLKFSLMAYNAGARPVCAAIKDVQKTTGRTNPTFEEVAQVFTGDLLKKNGYSNTWCWTSKSGRRECWNDQRRASKARVIKCYITKIMYYSSQYIDKFAQATPVEVESKTKKPVVILGNSHMIGMKYGLKSYKIDPKNFVFEDTLSSTWDNVGTFKGYRCAKGASKVGCCWSKGIRSCDLFTFGGRSIRHIKIYLHKSIKEIKKIGSDTVIIFEGTNALVGSSPKTVIKDLKSIVSTLHANNIKVYVAEMPEAISAMKNKKLTTANINYYNTKITTVGADGVIKTANVPWNKGRSHGYKRPKTFTFWLNAFDQAVNK